MNLRTNVEAGALSPNHNEIQLCDTKQATGVRLERAGEVGQTQSIRGALSRAFFSRVLVVTSVLAMAPAALRAVDDHCLPYPPTGWKVPFTMTTQNSARFGPLGYNVVSYTEGVLTSISWVGPYLQTKGTAQLFNDRYESSVAKGNLTPQPFSIYQADSVQLGISEAYIPPGSPISVGLTLNSWGGATFNFYGHCDASTNLLYGSFNKDTMVVIAFGTPHP